MFLDEAMIMVTLNDGNIVSVLDFGEVGGEYFLVMEYVRGSDLQQLLYPAAGNTAALPVDAAVYVAHQVCLGLDYVHRKVDAQGQPLNIIHRDIGPKNVLASNEGGVKITDFGIARASHRLACTAAGMVKGTLAYMSPEQVTGGRIDHRCDIYAVGAMLYELLTGLRPFEGATYREGVARITSGVYEKVHVVNPEIPKRLSEIIDKALKIHPSRRYQTAGEMAVDLQFFLLDRGLHPDANSLAELIRARRIQ